MRIALWHGWHLEGSGSNVFTSRVASALRERGHDVLLVCQDPAPERAGFIDGWGTVTAQGVSEIRPTGASPGRGRAVLLRPVMGSLLPVFVLDEYPEFEVKRFVDLTDADLAGYLQRNADALRRAVEWHRSDVVVAGHAIPGPAVARMALGPGRYAAKVHGSDLEYAVREDSRYRDLALEGLRGAVAITGASRSVLSRTADLDPDLGDRLLVVPPGVDGERFRPMPERQALLDAAARLDRDPGTARGRPSGVDAAVERALLDREGEAFARLAAGYDQNEPDGAAAATLRALAEDGSPRVGYFGKLIPQKGVHLFLQALALLPPPVRAVVVGFGTFREWLSAQAVALARRDGRALAWLAEAASIELDLAPGEVEAAGDRGSRVTFTGRLDHRYAPAALSALTVLVVPSTLAEAFGMVAVEGAAAGALPLVARHSGLAEVAEALEGAVDREGWFSYEPGPGAAHGIAAGLGRLLGIPEAERRELRRAVSDHALTTWTWDRTADLLLEAASRRRPVSAIES